MNKLVLIFLSLLLFGCGSAPKKQNSYEIEKNKMESVCLKFGASDISDLYVKLILPDMNTWDVQNKSKNQTYILKTDFFTSMVENSDSLFLIHTNANTIIKISVPKSFRIIDKNEFVAFRVSSCDALVGGDGVDFIINGSIIDAISN